VVSLPRVEDLQDAPASLLDQQPSIALGLTLAFDFAMLRFLSFSIQD
jgi:hypothetical protein